MPFRKDYKGGLVTADKLDQHGCSIQRAPFRGRYGDTVIRSKSDDGFTIHGLKKEGEPGKNLSGKQK